LPERAPVPSDSDLIETLAGARNDVGRWIVALWTWLTPRLRQLDSRAENLRSIRERGLDDLVSLPDLGAALAALRNSPDPLGEAARLLVALERWVAGNGRPDTVLSEPAPGVDGERYYVSSWSNWLPDAYWENSDRSRVEPPDSDYPPSIHALAPTLVVVPAAVDGIALETVGPAGDTDAWRCLQRARRASSCTWRRSGRTSWTASNQIRRARCSPTPIPMRPLRPTGKSMQASTRP
jgi:hypothetical protein